MLVPTGAPLYASEIVPLKPGPGVICRLNCAVWPAEIVAVVDPDGAAPKVNAGLAKPPRLITWGEFAASSVRVTVAERGPEASGAKETPNVQVPFTA